MQRDTPWGLALLGNVTKADCQSGGNATFSFTNYDDDIQGAKLEYWLYIALEYEYGQHTIEPHELAITYASRGDPLSNYQLYIGGQGLFRSQRGNCVNKSSRSTARPVTTVLGCPARQLA